MNKVKTFTRVLSTNSDIIFGLFKDKLIKKTVNSDKGLYVYTKEKIDNGKNYSWYPNGKIFSEGEYNNGKLDGMYRQYYIDGSRKFEFNFSNDIMNGICIYYYENNNIKYIRNYKDGKLHGQYFRFNNDGSLDKMCKFNNDVIDGIYKEFYPNNKLKLKCNYKNGIYDGDYIEFNFNGEPIVTKFYIDGIEKIREKNIFLNNLSDDEYLKWYAIEFALKH